MSSVCASMSTRLAAIVAPLPRLEGIPSLDSRSSTRSSRVVLVSTRMASTLASTTAKAASRVVPVSTRMASTLASTTAKAASRVVPVSTRMASTLASTTAKAASRVVPVSTRMASTLASTTPITTATSSSHHSQIRSGVVVSPARPLIYAVITSVLVIGTPMVVNAAAVTPLATVAIVIGETRYELPAPAR